VKTLSWDGCFMGVVEETGQVMQDFLPPELREMRGILSAIEKRLESQDKRLESQDKRLDLQDKRFDTIEEAARARYENIIQRLETIQQSFAFDKRISSLEEDKRRSAWLHFYRNFIDHPGNLESLQISLLYPPTFAHASLSIPAAAPCSRSPRKAACNTLETQDQGTAGLPR